MGGVEEGCGGGGGVEGCVCVWGGGCCMLHGCRWISSLPGELLETVYTEAMAALSLNGLPQDLETLLTFVFILHGH